MVRQLILTVSLVLLIAPAADARPCVLHGREIRNLERVTCAQARPILERYLQTLTTRGRWDCQGYRRQTWRGYCETRDGRRYFTWRSL